MVITLHIGASLDDKVNEPFLVFWHTLTWYFCSLEKGSAIWELGHVPSYDDKSFDLEFCRRLNTELPDLISLASRDELPNLPKEPDEEDDLDGPINSAFVLWFLNDLSNLLAGALDAGRGIVSIGD